MKTEDLIRTLSADAAQTARPMTATWRGAMALSVVLVAIAFFAVLHLRNDFAAVAASPRFLFKFVVTLALATTAWRLAIILSSPGAPAWGRARLLVLAPLLVAAAVVFELASVPAGEWGARMVGRNAVFCLTAIPLMGIAPLALFVAALRHGAPTSPGLAGAIAGLAAGGVSATFYALHCTDDSPLFMAVWYSLALAALALLGFVSARLVARW